MAVVTVATPQARQLYSNLIMPHLFAVLVGTLLSGMVLLQLCSYYTTSAKPSPRTLERALVAVIVVSSLMQLTVDWWSLFELVVTHVAEPLFALTFRAEDFLRLFSGAIAMGAAQIYFLHRAAKIVRMSKIFIAISALLWVAEMGAAIAVTTLGLSTLGEPRFYLKLADLTIAWFWLGAAVDVLATSVLCWKARKVFTANSKGSVSPSLRSLVHLSFATGFLTSALAIVGGIVYLIAQKRSNTTLPILGELALPFLPRSRSLRIVLAMLPDALPRISILSMIIAINSRAKAAPAPTHPTSEFPPFVVGFPSSGPTVGSAGIYSPTLDDKEYEIDYSAFERSSMASPSSRRRSSAATNGTGQFSRLPGVPELPRETPTRPIDWSHISEIGSEGDLERALRFYKADEIEAGVCPNLEAAPPPDEPVKTPRKRASFSLPALTSGQRLPHQKSCGCGIAVTRVVTTAVEE